MTDWPEIVKMHAQLVVGSIRRIVGNEEDTEDVTQEVFLEAYKSSQTQTIENWPGFLRTLATRRAIDRLRKRIREASHNPSSNTHEFVDSTPSPDLVAETKELAQQLRLAIAGLPTIQAKIFIMRSFEQMTYEQIGTALNMTSNAVGIALHKARFQLQALLTDKIPPGDMS